MRVGWSCLLAGSLGLFAAGASAQEPLDDLARRHFESGVAYLQESDHANALRAFNKAYELSKRPEILLNIATVQERLGALSQAIDALTRYLDAAPEGEHAETARLRIENLRKRLDEEQTAAPAEGPAPGQPPPSAPSPSPDRPPAREPNRTPAYVTFGVSGALGVGAIVTGVLASSKHRDLESSCAPGCSESQVSSGRTLAWTSTILTGLFVVGAGVGTVLWVTADGPERPARRKLGVALGPTSATAVWKF